MCIDCILGKVINSLLLKMIVKLTSKLGAKRKSSLCVFDVLYAKLSDIPFDNFTSYTNKTLRPKTKICGVAWYFKQS